MVTRPMSLFDGFLRELEAIQEILHESQDAREELAMYVDHVQLTEFHHAYHNRNGWFVRNWALPGSHA